MYKTCQPEKYASVFNRNEHKVLVILPYGSNLIYVHTLYPELTADMRWGCDHHTTATAEAGARLMEDPKVWTVWACFDKGAFPSLGFPGYSSAIKILGP